ncbi:uncharacterized protein N0V89_005659 [Didymosphaeria variabile]|uniref:Uncharacterized protein n=1 Tax=Didymosphaeria variabile TaxID=1932322 RepID=A0A9W8XNB2_9PLEO|nr:uncharacterized protein N0V89_005659 [Didymosphaeria variabile]KAJ4353928.1 hypothetical protein N0V89_005659 [Didymosphaeria variabile]
MLEVGDEDTTAMKADSVPVSIRQQVSTAPSERSIWTSVQDETTFRQAAVDLALTTSECPWDADIGLPPLPGAPHIGDYIDVPQPQPEREDKYILSEQIEHRLANDFALIAASREAVFSVTAACVEEHADTGGHLKGLKLWLAANEGVSEELKDSLTDIWDCLSHSTSEAETLGKVFAKIVYLNRLRIYQRVRKAVGHPPIFREKGRTRTNPDDKLSRAFSRMLKSHTKGSSQRLTAQGHELVRRGIALNVNLLALLESLSVDEIEHGSDDVLGQLEGISKECFNVTTDGGRVSFKHLLVESGLDARIWLKSKYVGEVDKIGVYWRITMSLFKIHGHISRGRPQALPPLKLEIEGVRPYVSVIKEPSIQGRPMPCYVHAEIQLITHLVQQDARADLNSSSTQPTVSRRPRIIGASKSACFLCFLFLNCYQGPKAPATHGRLYDQWTVPDLFEYTATHSDHLRQTLRLMHIAMVRLREDYCLKKPRDHPMTSRVDIDRLSLFTTTSEPDTYPRSVGMESQDEAGLIGRASSGYIRHEVLEGPCISIGAFREAESCPADNIKQEENDRTPHEGQLHGLRALFEKLRIKMGI